MLKIGVVGCGLQAATIAGYTGVYGDDYEVTAVKVYDFLQTMKTGQRARTDLITGNGISPILERQEPSIQLSTVSSRMAKYVGHVVESTTIRNTANF